jgi:hypothetical protein
VLIEDENFVPNQMASVVDIRRQNMIEHLMSKALFELLLEISVLLPRELANTHAGIHAPRIEELVDPRVPHRRTTGSDYAPRRRADDRAPLGNATQARPTICGEPERQLTEPQ